MFLENKCFMDLVQQSQTIHTDMHYMHTIDMHNAHYSP